ncbi:MAG TPA: flagellar filament capping protein FliD [Spirochaetota bacterium]|nr:flagellar filament capping protein FliD [Spirochaetota bacterium]
MPVTLGGVASGMDTDSIIAKLLDVEAQPIKQYEQDKKLSSYKKEALKNLQGKLKDLDGKARDLYGFRASFDDKLAVSSDSTVLDARGTKQADVGTKKIEVMQLASAHKISSDPVDGEKKLPAGSFTIIVNGVEKKVSFKGGKLKSLNDMINESASEIISSEYVNTEGTSNIIVLTSKTTGKKGEINFTGGEELLKEAGFIKGEKVTDQKDTPVVFDSKYIMSYSGEPKPEGQDGNMSVGRDGAELTINGVLWREYELPLKTMVEKDTVFRFTFKYDKQIEEKVPLRIETGPDEEINVKGIKLHSYNISRLRPLSKKEDRKFDTIIGVGAVVFDKGKRIEKIYPVDKDAANKYELPIGKDFEGKSLEKLIFYCNDGKVIFSDALIVTPVKSKGNFELKNIVEEAANAKLKVDGVVIERERNDELNDIIKGLVLNLKRKSEIPVEIKTTYDVDKSLKKIKDFVDSYNAYIDMHIQLTKTVKTDKPGQSEKLSESGLFVSDSTLIRLENMIKTTVNGAYSSRLEKQIRLFTQMGVSTGKVNSNWDSIKEGKLTIDEDELRKAIAENPEGVTAFFGADTDGDNRTDSGMAFTLVRELEPYISYGKNIIQTKIDYEDELIKMANQKIEKQMTHLKQYEEKLRKKFGTMEKTISGSKQQQDWMKNQMGGGK